MFQLSLKDNTDYESADYEKIHDIGTILLFINPHSFRGV